MATNANSCEAYVNPNLGGDVDNTLVVVGSSAIKKFLAENLLNIRVRRNENPARCRSAGCSSVGVVFRHHRRA